MDDPLSNQAQVEQLARFGQSVSNGACSLERVSGGTVVWAASSIFARRSAARPRMIR
jgi:hypothetical protein